MDAETIVGGLDPSLTEMAAVAVPLTQGQVALVDASDWERVSQHIWCASWNKATRSFYAIARVRSPGGKWTTIKMHRLIVGATCGQLVDHHNHNTLDNRRRNLRVVEGRQNSQNRRKQSSATSPFKGVHMHRGKWCARIADGEILLTGCRRLRHIGYFPTAEDAAQAYDDRARASFGAYAALNFPSSGEQGATRRRIQ